MPCLEIGLQFAELQKKIDILFYLRHGNLNSILSYLKLLVPGKFVDDHYIRHIIVSLLKSICSTYIRVYRVDSPLGESRCLRSSDGHVAI